MAQNVLLITGNDAEVCAQLSNVRTADKGAEKKKSLGCTAMALAPLGPVAVYGFPQSVPTLVAYLCGAFFVLGFILYLVGQAGDIDDNRYILLTRLHRFIAGDCHKNATFSYALDLRPYDHRAFFKERQKIGGGFFSGYPRGSTEIFESPILSGHAQLRDGTKIVVSATRTSRRRTLTRQNPRGKVKTKVKFKYGDRFTVQVKLPSDSPAASATPPVGTNDKIYGPRKPKYKASGRRVSTMVVEKTSYPVLDIGGLLRLLTWTFFAMKQGQRGITRKPLQ